MRRSSDCSRLVTAEAVRPSASAAPWTLPASTATTNAASSAEDSGSHGRGSGRWSLPSDKGGHHIRADYVAPFGPRRTRAAADWTSCRRAARCPATVAFICHGSGGRLPLSRGLDLASVPGDPSSEGMEPVGRVFAGDSLVAIWGPHVTTHRVSQDIEYLKNGNLARSTVVHTRRQPLSCQIPSTSAAGSGGA